MKVDGLLGRNLSHSFSPAVHQAMGVPRYRLFETRDVGFFLKNERFFAVNVTAPYKETVIPFLAKLDETARRTQSVNLIVREEKGLVGYNTDLYGFESSLRHHGVSLSGKKILVLGNGGVSRTVRAAAEDAGAASVLILARNPRGKGEIPFSESWKSADSEIVVNATPVGMFPENEGVLPLDPGIFSRAEFFFDLIYNPLETRMMSEFRHRGIPAVNGLFMLVAQAGRSQEIALGKNLPEDLVLRIAKNLRDRSLNLVLVGLPLSGKSVCARFLAESFRKTPVDTDAWIESECQMSISDVFRFHGEPRFRQKEVEIVDRIYRLGNQVIATGGGMIENPEIMAKLKQNGYVVFLDRNPEEIMKLDIEGRPLLRNPEDILRLAERRRSLYLRYADLVIGADGPIEGTIAEMEGRIHEHLDRERP